MGRGQCNTTMGGHEGREIAHQFLPLAKHLEAAVTPEQVLSDTPSSAHFSPVPPWALLAGHPSSDEPAPPRVSSVGWRGIPALGSGAAPPLPTLVLAGLFLSLFPLTPPCCATFCHFLNSVWHRHHRLRWVLRGSIMESAGTGCVWHTAALGALRDRSLPPLPPAPGITLTLPTNTFATPFTLPALHGEKYLNSPKLFPKILNFSWLSPFLRSIYHQEIHWNPSWQNFN